MSRGGQCSNGQQEEQSVSRHDVTFSKAIDLCGCTEVQPLRDPSETMEPWTHWVGRWTETTEPMQGDRFESPEYPQPGQRAEAAARRPELLDPYRPRVLRMRKRWRSPNCIWAGGPCGPFVPL